MGRSWYEMGSSPKAHDVPATSFESRANWLPRGDTPEHLAARAVQRVGCSWRSDEPRARPFPMRRREGALRRRADDNARRDAATHHWRVGRVGQSRSEFERVPDNEVVLSVRQRTCHERRRLVRTYPSFRSGGLTIRALDLGTGQWVSNFATSIQPTSLSQDRVGRRPRRPSAATTLGATRPRSSRSSSTRSRTNPRRRRGRSWSSSNGGVVVVHESSLSKVRDLRGHGEVSNDPSNSTTTMTTTSSDTTK